MHLGGALPCLSVCLILPLDISLSLSTAKYTRISSKCRSQKHHVHVYMCACVGVSGLESYTKATTVFYTILGKLCI